jgi:urea transport system ATP-binding protein
MLEVKALNLFYGESHVLWDIDLTLERGGRYSLLGRNGVGKSSLVGAVMGLHPIRRGQIAWKGRRLDGSKPWERVRQGLALVPQGREIFGRLTCEENLRLALDPSDQSLPGWIWEFFPDLKPLLNRMGGSLSGGQQQQLAIARSLLLKPELLILDEPTEGIQPNVVQQIGELLVHLSRQGLGILTIEQKVKFVRDFHENFFILEKGRIVAKGSVSDLDEGTVKKHLMV